MNSNDAEIITAANKATDEVIAKCEILIAAMVFYKRALKKVGATHASAKRASLDVTRELIKWRATPSKTRAMPVLTFNCNVCTVSLTKAQIRSHKCGIDIASINGQEDSYTPFLPTKAEAI